MRIDVPTGQDPKAFLNASFAPEIVGAAQALYRACYANASLTLREFEGARMRMAEINGCLLCQDWRSGGPEAAAMIARTELAGRETVADRGPAPDEEFYASVSQWRDFHGYSERERLAIGFAERLSLDPQGLADDDEFWARMHAAWTDAEIVDLSYCAFSWFQGRISHVLGVDGSCALPA